MAEQAIEEQDSLNPVEEQVQEKETVSAEDLAEKNKQLYERAKKAEAKAKELESKLNPDTSQTNKSFSESERDLIVDLRLEGYSKTEADFILKNGGRQALDDSLVMSAIEATRKKAKSVEATPSGTNKSAVYQKFSEQDLRKMSAEELEKIVPQG